MSKGEQTRQAILDQGLELARVAGVTGVTIGALAEHTGMSKSGLYGHFGSKTALEIGILDHAAEQYRREVIQPAWNERHIGRRLWRLFDLWLAWGDRNRHRGGCVFMAAGMELDDQVSEARDRLVAIQREWLDNLARCIDRGVERGELPAGLDGAQAAHDLYSIVMGFHHAHGLMHDPAARDKAETAFARLFGPRPG